MNGATRRNLLVLGIGCWTTAFVTYLIAVRTATGRDLDTSWMRTARERLSQFSWIPGGPQLARDQLPMLAIGLGVVCATCLVTHCRPRTAVAALALSCGPAVIADCLKSTLQRPAGPWDLGAHNSFPSGTVAAFAGMAAALTYLARGSLGRAVAGFAWLVCGVVILTVVKAHWHRPSDIAGALLITAGCWAIARGLAGSPDGRTASSPPTDVHERGIPVKAGL